MDILVCARNPRALAGPRPRSLNHEFTEVDDRIFNTPIASIAKATLLLQWLPRNPKTDRVLQLTRQAIVQLDGMNLMSSLHRTASRTSSAAVQDSHTPGGGTNQRPHQQQIAQHDGNQDEQEVARPK